MAIDWTASKVKEIRLADASAPSRLILIINQSASTAPDTIMKKFLGVIFSTAILLSACSTTQVSESETRAEYDRIVARMTDQEYNVRHILVEHRWQAEAALVRIKSGEAFGPVARDVSQDPGSAPQGGEMGWNVPAHFVPEFSEAMVRLGASGLTAEPVKSPFGWHVIEVTGMRKEQPPPFDELKDQIAKRLKQKKERLR